MDEALAQIAGLSPLAAVVVLTGLAASIVTQLVKRPGWSKGRVQVIALVVSVVLGVLAYVVSGVATVFPASAVDAVSTGVVVAAGVAVMSRAAYALIGHAMPGGDDAGADG